MAETTRTCEICDGPLRLTDDDDGYRLYECRICGAEFHEIDDNDREVPY